MRRICAYILMLAALSGCAIFSPPRPYLPNRSGLQQGQTIVAQSNENIYAIAREHNVSMRDLIVLNNLRPPYEVRPGQSIILPATTGGGAAADDMPPPQAAPLGAVEKNELPPVEPAAVSSEALAPITPAAASSPSSSAARPASMPFGIGPSVPPPSMPAPVAAPPPESKSTAPLSLLQAEPVPTLNRPAPPPKPMATTTSQDAEADATGAMIWPVQGPVLSAFGAKGPGLNNDGVNIGAPKGSPVVAAAPGTVVYAGDEMKGFGNLVLIRHAGDWVTAYAHLDRVLVKKDSVVGQGDMIGTVGKTGNVSTPQLHFETRKGGKPVDPAGVVKGAL